MELINRKDLDDSIKYLTDEYGWLLSLNSDNLIKETIETNNVQNALLELFGFIEKIVELPVIATEVEYCGALYLANELKNIIDNKFPDSKC